MAIGLASRAPRNKLESCKESGYKLLSIRLGGNSLQRHTTGEPLLSSLLSLRKYAARERKASDKQATPYAQCSQIPVLRFASKSSTYCAPIAKACPSFVKLRTRPLSLAQILQPQATICGLTPCRTIDQQAAYLCYQRLSENVPAARYRELSRAHGQGPCHSDKKTPCTCVATLWRNAGLSERSARRGCQQARPDNAASRLLRGDSLQHGCPSPARLTGGTCRGYEKYGENRLPDAQRSPGRAVLVARVLQGSSPSRARITCSR